MISKLMIQIKYLTLLQVKPQKIQTHSFKALHFYKNQNLKK